MTLASPAPAEKSTSSPGGHCSPMQCEHVHVFMGNHIHPISFAVSLWRKACHGPAHTREGNCAKCKYQEEGITGTTLAFLPKRVIRMLKTPESMVCGKQSKGLEKFHLGKRKIIIIITL